MRTLGLALLCGLSLACAAPAAEKEKKKSDADKMQGTWLVVKAEFSGVVQPDELIGTLKFVIKGDKVVVMGVPQVGEQHVLIKLDSTATPRLIDLTKLGPGDKKGDEVEGIYEFKSEDEMKWCVKLVGKDRPGEFATKENDNRALIEFKREK